MADLPLDLQKLQTVRGALEILVYLYGRPDFVADPDDIMDDLDMNTRRFDKAKRRLVTTGYIQMRGDYLYELTPKGEESAELLTHMVEQDEAQSANKVQREIVLALPRNLVAGQESPLQIGFAPQLEQGHTDIILRLQAIHAEIGDYDEIIHLNANKHIIETTIQPLAYDQARLRLEVFQTSASSDDLTDCGGLYVDVLVMDGGDTGEMMGYSATLEFEK
ncbi:MAG: hypothetical protein KC496_04600 [Anaerolineae bacterium]|nr:hypothetical protein [Anaerolineae bacterium]